MLQEGVCCVIHSSLLGEGRDEAPHGAVINGMITGDASDVKGFVSQPVGSVPGNTTSLYLVVK